jgi:hypothetical protein
MSILMIVFLVLGAAATILFVAGYVRGVREAIATHADPELEVDDSGDVDAFWWQIAVAVVAGAVVIFLAGVNPAFIYLGPLLVIGTAAMNGLAFFVDKPPRG